MDRHPVGRIHRLNCTGVRQTVGRHCRVCLTCIRSSGRRDMPSMTKGHVMSQLAVPLQR